MAGGHNARTTSWIAVVLIIIGSSLLGVSLPAQSLPLAIAGGAVLLGGLVVAGVFRIMDDAY